MVLRPKEVDNMNNDTLLLKKKATEIRLRLIQMIYEAQFGHTGGSLSNTDILTTLYYKVLNVDPGNPKWEDRDRYVQSKGHAVESYWTILADKGFFPMAELKTFTQFGSKLSGHPNNEVPGVEMNTGALGHGLSISVGLALAAKLSNKSSKLNFRTKKFITELISSCARRAQYIVIDKCFDMKKHLNFWYS